MKGVETKDKLADWKSTYIIVEHLKIIQQSIMGLGICEASVVRQGCLIALLALMYLHVRLLSHLVTH